MNQKIVTMMTAAMLSIGAVFAETAPSSWQGVTINVKATKPVATTQQVTEQEDGFARLKVTLANEGTEHLTIEKVTVRIPLTEKTTNETELLFGGSDMGRAPVSRQSIGKLGRISSSQFFTIVKLAENDYLFAGSLSWRIFLPNITVKDGAYEITSKGEGKQLSPGQKIDYEQIVLTRSNNWVTLLNRFGTAIAKENGVAQLKDITFNGWATWDYYGRIFVADDVLKNMEQLIKLPVKSNMVQIDGGWWTQRGDYTSVRPNLPGGIKAIADQIRAEGKTVGLHFDGFRGDAKAEICKTHPEYFLHDQDGKLIVETKEMVDMVMDYTFFDYSHPGARAHIAECIKAMKSWGITYFKVDFMRYGLEDDIKRNVPTVKSFKAYDPTITGVERFRLGIKAIRDAIGQDNYFLGCSAVFGPTIGFVDAMRTAGDIHPVYDAFGERALGNTGNFYLKSVFNLDPDYIVVRAAADEDETVFGADKKKGGTLTENEGQMWTDFVSLFGNVRLNSDNLKTLRPARKAIVAGGLKSPKMDETIPLDLWNHATNKLDAVELILSRSGTDIYLGVFNWADTPKAYSLPSFGKSAADLQLKARHSVILKYEGTDSFEALCDKLKSN
jgi:alpha-galactosidase